MAIRIFDMLGPVLDEQVAAAARTLHCNHEAIYEQILQEAQRNQDEWYSRRVPNLNYCQLVCRLAYLYIVAGANANAFKWILANDAELNEYVISISRQRRRINVCALGAGPGTELMA